MSTEQERIDAHRAAVMVWAHRIPAVLASPDAARGLALAVVGELLCIFGRGPLADALHEVGMLCGEAIALSAGGMDLGDIRARTDLLGSRLFLRSALTWRWDTRIPYEVCEALRRACEDEAVLCGGCLTGPCGACGGTGRMLRWSTPSDAQAVVSPCEGIPCPTCNGARVELLVPPLLALLLHDAHGLLVDLRADVTGLESLVRDAEARERARTKGDSER